MKIGASLTIAFKCDLYLIYFIYRMIKKKGNKEGSKKETIVDEK